MDSLMALTSAESNDFIQAGGGGALCPPINFGQVNGMGHDGSPGGDRCADNYVNSCVSIGSQSASDAATAEYLQKQEEEELLQAFVDSDEVVQGIAQALDVDSLTPSFVSEQSFELSVADVDLEPEDRPHCRFPSKPDSAAAGGHVNGNRTQDCAQSLLMTGRTTGNALAIEMPATEIPQQQDIHVPPTGIQMPIDTGMVVEVMEMADGRETALDSTNPPNDALDFGYRSYSHNFGADAVIEKESDTSNLTSDEQEADGKITSLLVAVTEAQYTVHSGYSPKAKQESSPKAQPRAAKACPKAKKVKLTKASPSKVSPSKPASVCLNPPTITKTSARSPKLRIPDEHVAEAEAEGCVEKSLKDSNLRCPNKSKIASQKVKLTNSLKAASAVGADKEAKAPGKRTAKVSPTRAKAAPAKEKAASGKAKRVVKAKVKSDDPVVAKSPKAKKAKQPPGVLESSAKPKVKGSKKKNKSLPISVHLSKVKLVEAASSKKPKRSKGKSKDKDTDSGPSCDDLTSPSSKSNTLITKSLTSPKPTKAKPKTKSSTASPKEKVVKGKGCKTKSKKKLDLCISPLPVASQLPLNSPSENSIPPVLEIVTKVTKKLSKNKKAGKKSKSGKSKSRTKVLGSTIVHTDGLLQVATKLNRRSKTCKITKKEKKLKRTKKHKRKEKQKGFVADRPPPPPATTSTSQPLHILIPDEEPIASPLSSPPCPPSKGKGKKSGSGVARLMNEWLLENGHKEEDEEENMLLHRGKQLQNSKKSGSPKSTKASIPGKETSAPVSPVSSSCFGTPTKIQHVFAEPVKTLHEVAKKRPLNVDPIRPDIMEGSKEKQHKEQTPSPQSATTCMSEETMFSDSGIGTDNNSNPDQHALDKHRRRSVPSVTESDMSSELLETHPLATSAHGLYSYGKKDKHRKPMNWHFGPHRKRRKKYRFMRQPGRMSRAFVFELDTITLELSALQLDMQEDIVDVTKTMHVYTDKELEPKNHLSVIAKLIPNYSSYLRPSYLATVLGNPSSKNSKHKSGKKKKKEKEDKRRRDFFVEDSEHKPDKCKQYLSTSVSQGAMISNSIDATPKPAKLVAGRLFQGSNSSVHNADLPVMDALSVNVKVDLPRLVFGEQRTEPTDRLSREKQVNEGSRQVSAVEEKEEVLNIKTSVKAVSKKPKSKRTKSIKSLDSKTSVASTAEGLSSFSACTGQEVPRPSTVKHRHLKGNKKLSEPVRHRTSLMDIVNSSGSAPPGESGTVISRNNATQGKLADPFSQTGRNSSNANEKQATLLSEHLECDAKRPTEVSEFQAQTIASSGVVVMSAPEKSSSLGATSKPPIKRKRRRRIARFTPPKSKAYMRKRLEVLKKRAEEALSVEGEVENMQETDGAEADEESDEDNITAADFENNNIQEGKEEFTGNCHHPETKQPQTKQPQEMPPLCRTAEGCTDVALSSLLVPATKKKTKTASESVAPAKRTKKLRPDKTKSNHAVKGSGDLCIQENLQAIKVTESCANKTQTEPSERTPIVKDTADATGACIGKCASVDAGSENKRTKGKKALSQKLPKKSGASTKASKTGVEQQKAQVPSANTPRELADNIFDRLQNCHRPLQKEIECQDTVVATNADGSCLEPGSTTSNTAQVLCTPKTGRVTKKQTSKPLSSAIKLPKTPVKKRAYNKTKPASDAGQRIQAAVETAAKKTCKSEVCRETLLIATESPDATQPAPRVDDLEDTSLQVRSAGTATPNDATSLATPAAVEFVAGELPAPLGEASPRLDAYNSETVEPGRAQELETFTVAKIAAKAKAPKVPKKKLQMGKVQKIVLKRTVEAAAVDESSKPLKKRKLMKEPVVTCADDTLISLQPQPSTSTAPFPTPCTPPSSSLSSKSPDTLTVGPSSAAATKTKKVKPSVSVCRAKVLSGQPQSSEAVAPGGVRQPARKRPVPKKSYWKAGIYSSTFKLDLVTTKADDDNSTGEDVSKPDKPDEETDNTQEVDHGILPLPILSGSLFWEEEDDFQLPFDLWWLHTHNKLSVRQDPSKYKKLRNNIYYDVKPLSNTQNICNCQRPREPAEKGCGEDCLNRMVLSECSSSTCPCDDLCSNQRILKHEWAPGLQRFITKDRGWGIRTKYPIKTGDFILEYVGEVISVKELWKRALSDYQYQKHHYYLNLDSGTVIDGYRYGNEGRFVNHSCEPNCEMQKWSVNGMYRVALFALRDVEGQQELTYDYNFHAFNLETQQECRCGSAKCRGTIGGKKQKLNGVLKKEPGKKAGKKFGRPVKDKRKSKNNLKKREDSADDLSALKGMQLPIPRPMSVREMNLIADRSLFLLRNIEKIKRVRESARQGSSMVKFSSPEANKKDVFMAQFTALKTSRSVKTRRLAAAEVNVEVTKAARLAQVFKDIYTVVCTYRDTNGQSLAIPFMNRPSKKRWVDETAPLPLLTSSSPSSEQVLKRNQDYYQRISDPIDLSTIERHIMSGYYKTVEKFDEHFMRVFKNAEKYHGKKSELGRDAADLRKAYIKVKLDNAKFFEDILGEPQREKEHGEDTKAVKEEEEEEVIRCLCGLFNDEGLMIQCEKCLVWQHCDCIDMKEPAENYLCELCLPRPVPKEIVMVPQPKFAQPEQTYYLCLQRDESLTIRQGCCVYLANDNQRQTADGTAIASSSDIMAAVSPDELNIFRVEKLWKNQDGERFAFGHHFLRPYETHHTPSRKFFKNELFRVPLYEFIKLEVIVGVCCVMDLYTYCKGRPKGVQEKDVYICEYRLDKTAHLFNPISRNKHPISTKTYAFDKFDQKLVPKRDYSPHLVPEHFKRGYGGRTTCSKDKLEREEGDRQGETDPMPQGTSQYTPQDKPGHKNKSATAKTKAKSADEKQKKRGKKREKEQSATLRRQIEQQKAERIEYQKQRLNGMLLGLLAKLPSKQPVDLTYLLEEGNGKRRCKRPPHSLDGFF